MQRIPARMILSMFGIALVSVAWLGLKDSFDRISCERRERAYTVCKLEKVQFGRAWTDTSFRLKGAEVEEHWARDSEGNKYTAYRVRLATHTESLIFHDYDRDYQGAYADVGQFHDLLSGFALPSLQIKYAVPQSGFIVTLLSLPTVAAIHVINSRHRRTQK